MQKKKNSRITTVLLTLIFIAGLSLVLYPSFSNYWNSLHQTRAIASFSEAVSEMDSEEYDAFIQAAREYNSDLSSSGGSLKFAEENRERYETLLNLLGNGMMGYIEIPVIDVSLPVYHGTADNVLQRGVGHLDWSALPIGGESTHCVLSGHRGLPSAKLFTDLDDLVEGDIFTIRILNEVVTYEVDQISIVLPSDTGELQIIPGEDYCTLLTCTPYGINTHRLLVRGRRIANAEEAAYITIPAELVQIEPIVIAGILAVPILILIITGFFLTDKNARKKPRSVGKYHSRKID